MSSLAKYLNANLLCFFIIEHHFFYMDRYHNFWESKNLGRYKQRMKFTSKTFWHHFNISLSWHKTQQKREMKARSHHSHFNLVFQSTIMRCQRNLVLKSDWPHTVLQLLYEGKKARFNLGYISFLFLTTQLNKLRTDKFL